MGSLFKRNRFLIITALVVILAVVLPAVLKSAYVPPVIMYHSIDYDSDKTKLSVSPESFERQMKFLKDHKYSIMPLGDMIGFIRNNKPLPTKAIAVTFDDGLSNNYRYAYPVLKKYGIPATFFVITGMIGEKGHMSWEELSEMQKSGLATIGSHSITHRWLTSLSDSDLKIELESSRQALKAHLGNSADLFCYPAGIHDARVKKSVEAAGYLGAVATNPGPLKSYLDIYAIKRIRISRTSDSLLVFWIETSGYYTWIKEHRDD